MATTEPKLLRTYTDPSGVRRELILRSAAGGSLLVIDRRPGRERDERLLAHLHPDEPPANAALLCHDYLAREPAQRRCRPVNPADTRTPPRDQLLEAPGAGAPSIGGVLRDGVRFELELCSARLRIPELRWTRAGSRSGPAPRTISLREAIGEAESYEPFRTLTREAIARHRDDAAISTITLRTELERVGASAIVLNRALREAVLRAVRGGETSMSEIAIRCGRVKRDGSRVDALSAYLLRGRRIGVDGRLRWREWEGEDGKKRQAVSIVADAVQFLDSPGERAEEPPLDDVELVGAGAGGGSGAVEF